MHVLAHTHGFGVHVVPTPLKEGAFACGVSLVEQIELFGVAASALHP
jgi:hypothetical protein